MALIQPVVSPSREMPRTGDQKLLPKHQHQKSASDSNLNASSVTARYSTIGSVPVTHWAGNVNDVVDNIDPLSDMLKEQTRLQQQLAALEGEVLTSRKTHDLLKMKATITLGQMRLQIDLLEEDNQCLTEKCNKLQHKMFDLTSNSEDNMITGQGKKMSVPRHQRVFSV